MLCFANAFPSDTLAGRIRYADTLRVYYSKCVQKGGGESEHGCLISVSWYISCSVVCYYPTLPHVLFKRHRKGVDYLVHSYDLCIFLYMPLHKKYTYHCGKCIFFISSICIVSTITARKYMFPVFNSSLNLDITFCLICNGIM